MILNLHFYYLLYKSLVVLLDWLLSRLASNKLVTIVYSNLYCLACYSDTIVI